MKDEFINNSLDELKEKWLIDDLKYNHCLSKHINKILVHSQENEKDL